VKTLTDPGATAIKLTPKTTSVRALRRLRAPADVRHRSRIPGVETTVFRVRVLLEEMKLEADDDIHLVIGQAGAPSLTMIVEFPAGSCTPGAGLARRRSMGAARQALIAACGTPSPSSFRHLRGTATITGVGFFDVFHGQTGVAPNRIELHPALKITRISCRPATPPPPPPPTTTVAPPSTSATTTQTTPTATTSPPTTTTAANCAPSYPDVCIPPPPPDLDCKDIPYRNFRVIYTVPDPDPHRFDADHDGTGCES
jgi:hypothetical protein